MAGESLRLCRRLSTPLLRQCNFSSHKIVISSRGLTSAASRPSSFPPSTRLPRSPQSTSLPSSSSSSNTIPDLCLGAGGKAPGFVQQMLFSAPVQEKNSKVLEQGNHDLLGDKVIPNGNSPTVQNNPHLPHPPYKFSH